MKWPVNNNRALPKRIDDHIYNRIPMLAFEVYLNGKKLCTAGIGNDGVLSAIVAAAMKPNKEHHLTLQVGGLVSPVDEHRTWVRQETIHVGDEVRVKIVETEFVDGPVKIDRSAP